MEKTKQWWKSLGVWGPVGALIAFFAGELLDIDLDAGQVTERIIDFIEVAGVLLGLYGRVRATKRLAT
jgi:hypothetical protein